MIWELEFLKTLGQMGNQNPSLNWLSHIFQVITITGDIGLIWIVAGIVMLFFKSWRKCGIVLLSGMLVFSLLMNNVLIKHVVNRPRPFTIEGYTVLEDYILGRAGNTQWLLEKGKGFLGIGEIPNDASFMSGHSFSSFLSAIIIFKYHKKVGIGALVYAALIAFSRLYFGVHYPTDVICGTIFGIIIGYITCLYADDIEIGIKKLIEKHKQKKLEEKQ